MAKCSTPPDLYQAEYDQLYGPYTRKDGRKVVVLRNSITMCQRTISYPKFIMEIHIGRQLNYAETVDHIDRDFTNDNISNLQILLREDHAAKDTWRIKPISLHCSVCGSIFSIAGRKARDAFVNRYTHNTTGPYCSRQCAGKASNNITLQYRHEIIIEKFRL